MDADQATSDPAAEGIHALAVLVEELLGRVDRLEAYTVELEAKLRTQAVLYRELERRVQTDWQKHARMAPLEEQSEALLSLAQDRPDEPLG